MVGAKAPLPGNGDRDGIGRWLGDSATQADVEQRRIPSVWIPPGGCGELALDWQLQQVQLSPYAEQVAGSKAPTIGHFLEKQ